MVLKRPKQLRDRDERITYLLADIQGLCRKLAKYKGFKKQGGELLEHAEKISVEWFRERFNEASDE